MQDLRRQTLKSAADAVETPGAARRAMGGSVRAEKRRFSRELECKESAARRRSADLLASRSDSRRRSADMASRSETPKRRNSRFLLHVQRQQQRSNSKIVPVEDFPEDDFGSERWREFCKSSFSSHEQRCAEVNDVSRAPRAALRSSTKSEDVGFDSEDLEFDPALAAAA